MSNKREPSKDSKRGLGMQESGIRENEPCQRSASIDLDTHLSKEEMMIIDERLADMEANPSASIPLEEAKRRIEARLRS